MKLDIIFVIGSDAQAFRSICALAPGLSEVELKVCIYLASQQHPTHHSVRASSREIAEAMRFDRKAVKSALDKLDRRRLIVTRQGGGTQPSAYLLNFTQTTAIQGGGLKHPPAQTTLDLQGQGWVSQTPTSPDHKSPSISITSDSIIDRALTARPNHFQRAELDAVKGYAFKWLLRQRGKEHAQPPDDTTCAQLIVACRGARLACDFVLDNLQDRQAENCMYLVSMALQKIHGIAPPTVKRRRAELRALNGGKSQAPPPAERQPDPEFTAELTRQLKAGAKSIR
ncbi:MAG TPA: hypothetical protein VKU19_14420 [Bryobacteraceae bacterium]|nr:hypothetical protein [Bryobacteraceae bacterium]